METQIYRISRTHSALLLVDLQEKLVPAIARNEQVVRNCTRLVQGAGLLKVPVFATEQYPRGLGRTLPAVAAAVPGFAPFEKVAFSACGAEGFMPALKAGGAGDVIICGIEAHVCVMQTCLDLLAEAYGVFVVADAVGSRSPEDYQLALERMRGAGAIIVSTEMVLFELLERAGTDEFKAMLSLIR